MLNKNKGPTDYSIRQFHDTWNDYKRYKKIHKRERKRIKETLRKLKQMKWKDIDD